MPALFLYFDLGNFTISGRVLTSVHEYFPILFSFITVISSTATSSINFVVCQGNDKMKIRCSSISLFYEPESYVHLSMQHKQCHEKRKKSGILKWNNVTILDVEHRRNNGVSFKMKTYISIQLLIGNIKENISREMFTFDKFYKFKRHLWDLVSNFTC